MSRQLKVEGEQRRINTILKSAIKVAEEIYSFTNHREGYFALVIRSDMVPPEWADAAFALRARRHDAGYGENACSIWIFPVQLATRIYTKFPVLISALDHQRQPIAVPAYKLAQMRQAPAGGMAYV
jgi:hypothetical protein